MGSTQDTLLEVQRQVLATMRRMFLTGMSCFKAMDYQMEQFVRLMSARSVQSQEQTFKLFDEWTENFRKAQSEYKRFVEESFKRAEAILDKAKKGG